MNHIFYQTKTKYTNTGDVLINRALIEMLRGYGSIHANCSREVPEHFLQMLGLKSSEQVFAENELRFLGEIWKQAGQAKKNGDFVYIFSGPGELSGGNWKMAFRNAALGFLLPVLRLRGIRLVRIGRSISCVSKSMALSEWFRCLSSNGWCGILRKKQAKRYP